MRVLTQNDFELILDVFGGYDSGVSFARFRAFMDEVDKAAFAGDDKAEEVILIMRRFAQTVRVGTGENKIRE